MTFRLLISWYSQPSILDLQKPFQMRCETSTRTKKKKPSCPYSSLRMTEETTHNHSVTTTVLTHSLSEGFKPFFLFLVVNFCRCTFHYSSCFFPFLFSFTRSLSYLGSDLVRVGYWNYFQVISQHFCCVTAQDFYGCLHDHWPNELNLGGFCSENL